MKKFLLICSLFFVSSLSLMAQDFDESESNEKIRDKMNEYIQKRLELNDAESKKFSPIFLDYFKEWRKTLERYKGPDKKLERQQKVVELRLRYRPKFQEVVGDKRGSRVYDLQDRFMLEMRQLQKSRKKKQ
ncbi:MAG: hypothetical protein NVV59_15875 [Chitinophagaceae bacterium]|nr:hypothetical protein [Chitinophagaceae bacterium]